MTDEDVTVERLSPEAAFGLLGHGIRFGILEALNDAGRPLSFSELRERVDVDDPGQFNYHLGELRGRFVREAGDEYRLAAAGKRVVGAVLSGGVTGAMAGDEVETEATCLECGAPMAARFREDGVAIECTDCGMQYTDPDVPSGIVEGSEDVATAVERWSRRNAASIGYGLCQYCDGPVEWTLCLPGEEAAPDWFDAESSEVEGLEATAVYDCDRCGEFQHAIPPLAILTHPAVMGFHYDHGIDLRETPAWELPWLAVDLATVVSEDPLRVEVPITLEGERLTLTFDRDLSVVAEGRGVVTVDE